MADAPDSLRTSLHVFPDLEALSRAAAQHVVSHIDRVLSKKDRYTLALAGGTTPRRLYELLSDVYSGGLRWQRVHLFWTDERFVPHSHPKSNARLATDTLVDQIDIPAENVHPIPTGGSPDDAARRYADTLRSFFDTPHHTFDAALLGLGADGHTASLFPDQIPGAIPTDGQPSTDPDDPAAWVRPVTAPSEHDVETRLTCTLPVLNGSDQALFLVSGTSKREAFTRVFDEQDPSLPATHVVPRSQLSWFVDTPARPE